MAKLFADDIISITLKQDNNSYTFPMQEILTSLTLKNLYEHVPHDDAPVTDPVMGILSLMMAQTEAKPTEQKSQSQSTTQNAETGKTSTKSTGGILSNFNKLAKKVPLQPLTSFGKSADYMTATSHGKMPKQT